MTAYTPTVWVNDQAPALSAANLNKLTNELEAQAAQLSISHTLPNWADGAVPALTEATPLNEMERVVLAVATALGLPYTKTVWEIGWVPARNAARFNKLEVQVVANRVALDIVPPPPPPLPVGWTVAAPQGTLVEMNGGGTQGAAKFEYSVGPVTFAERWIHDYTHYGYGLMQWPAQVSPPGVRSTIRDLRIERITRNPPRASDGTAEAGLWTGQTVDVSRIDIASCAWMQGWTGARCYNSIWQDIRMRDTRLVGIYPEHNTWDTIFRRFINEEAPGQLANTVNQEWAYGGEFSKNLTYDQFDLYVPAGKWAFFIDAGNGGTKIAPSPGSRIWGPGNGIILPNNIVAGVGPNQVWLDNIDMTELAGTKLAYHDNAIGSITFKIAAASRSWVGLAPKLHTATVRMPKEVKDSLAAIAAR